MNVPAPVSGTDSPSTRPVVPAQRTPDAFAAYASVHQLGIAMHHAGDEDGDLRTPA